MEKLSISVDLVKSLNNISENILVIAGTRPEITKLSPLINAIDAKVLLTGQHYSKEMRESFLKLLTTKKIDIKTISTPNQFKIFKYSFATKIPINNANIASILSINAEVEALIIF